MKLHITNGRLIDPKNKKDGPFDLLIENQKIAEILLPGKKIKDAKLIDAKGCIVSPGFIDLHTHLREPGFEYKETIETGTRAAAVGGFTSICCMANTKPVNDQASITNFILKQALEKGLVNVFPIGALTKGLAGKELSEMGELKQAGCIAVSDDGLTVENSQLMRLAMGYAKNFSLPVITHSMDACLASHGVMHEGAVSTRLGLPGIPNEAEDMMIARDIYLSQLTGCRLHVAHVSTAGGIELIANAKKKGLPVTCEVTPHHLTLTDERVLGYDTRAKMAPPLRPDKDRKILVKALADGVIDAIATDHAPHAVIDKEVEFEKAANGIIGLETALTVVLQLVHQKAITLQRLIEVLTSGPASVVGLTKGSLHVGADADITIFNPDEKVMIDESWFQSKSHNSPFVGMQLKGRVCYTIVGGRVVYGE